MIKKLIVLLLISNCSLLYAQTTKTDVLVIGGSASGFAAALQCARSKVKTILVKENSVFNVFPTTGMCIIGANRNLPSGIWGEFRTQIQEYYKNRSSFDTVKNGMLKFEGTTGEVILEKMIDTIKNLTIYHNTQFAAIKKDGDRWDVTLTQNGNTTTVKARVVVDATESGEVVTKTNTKLPINSNGSNETIYRTAISVEAHGAQFNKDKTPLPLFNFVPMSDVVVKGADNLLVTEKILPEKKSLESFPSQLETGQGAGTVAAYCAFFKTTTKNLKVRIIQGELLDFKGYLIPFIDVSQKDPDWRSIQQISATGLLLGRWKAHGDGNFLGEIKEFLFLPDETVNTSEIKPILTEIYTRAFLWFNKEKPAEKFTVGNMISFMSDFTLTDAGLMKANIQKAWKTQYKFKSDFDLSHQITRREFAVLANKYLNPFARTVDLNGRLVN